jgi:hypothetical protein
MSCHCVTARDPQNKITCNSTTATPASVFTRLLEIIKNRYHIPLTSSNHGYKQGSLNWAIPSLSTKMRTGCSYGVCS